MQDLSKLSKEEKIEVQYNNKLYQLFTQATRYKESHSAWV